MCSGPCLNGAEDILNEVRATLTGRPAPSLGPLADLGPVSLQLVELKNGETYNGHLVSCDNWMNINLREVICTSRVSALGLSLCLTPGGHWVGRAGMGSRGSVTRSARWDWMLTELQHSSFQMK